MMTCDRCGNEFDGRKDSGGNCPGCGDDLCETCARWVETEDGGICRACAEHEGKAE